jgi:hypothetical protein
MMSGRTILLALCLIFVGTTHAQQLAPPIAVEPQSIEISTPAAPAQMRAEDARQLIEQLGIAPQTAVPAAPLIAPGSSAQRSAGVRRTIPVKSSPVVNNSTYFQFRDVTERAHTVTPERSMAERHAAAEAYRQSLVNPRGRR